MRALLFISMLSFTGIVLGQGNNCNCQEIVGSCSASISVIPTKSEKGSYVVDLKIQSSAPMCSKVEYYIDSTPYFTILSQGHQGADSAWGQNPITRQSLTGIACKVCRQENPSKGNGGDKKIDERVNAEGGAKIVVSRPAGEQGSAITHQLFIDGKSFGEIRNGQSATTSATSGSHTLKTIRVYQGAWQGECSHQVSTDGQSTYKFSIENKQLTGITANSTSEAACWFNSAQ